MFFGRAFSDEGVEVVEVLRNGFETRLNLVGEEMMEDFAELSFGDVVIPTLSWDGDGVDGLEFTELAEALTGGTETDAKLLDDILHAEGDGGQVNDAVDLTEGFGQTQGLGGFSEE